MTGRDSCFFVRMCRFLLITALFGVVLAGCTPTNSGAGTPAGGCDPKGFGPFSGCSDTATEQPAGPVTGSCDPSGIGPFSGCGDDQGDPPRDDTGGDVPDDQATAQDMAEAAKHEAWHKAVADEYGWHVQSVRISPDGSGVTDLACCGWPAGATLDQQLTFILAGQASTESEESLGWLDDFRQAAELMEQANVPPADRDRMAADARAEATRIAGARSGQVDRDINRLLKDGSL